MSKADVSAQHRRHRASATGSFPSTQSWLRRVFLAPGRMFLLAVLSLMELCGLPKIRSLKAIRGDGDERTQEVQ